MLVLGLERRPDDTGRGVVDQHVERPELCNLGRDALRGYVAADEHRLSAELTEQAGGLLGRPVVSQVADRDLGGAELGEAKGDRPTDTA